MTANGSEPAPSAPLALAGLLQLMDSGFPSGAFTLSHGLETLVTEGVVRDVSGLVAVIETQLISRLARADLPATMAAASDTPLETLIRIDRVLLATKLAEEERTGSCRVGRRLLAETRQLEPDLRLDAFAAAVDAGRTPGNGALALGLAAAAFGVAPRDAAVGAASSFVMGQAMAAVRLGMIGHRDAQLAIRRSGTVIVRAVDIAERQDPLDPRPCAPALDVALARHEVAGTRMFAS
ncbi:MAG: hypothetical protein KF809_17795 [Chloroflexi bacterium]|nr:hypothetical protein [Chloroflexota bacterium]